ncbi:thioesterase family protein [Cohaesibacter celericrescens]|uniref:thioesterase family protein n=1 Tax=Cohaesibacter celericrescens TaxID=2067669 RepID=UPI003566FC7F
MTRFVTLNQFVNLWECDENDHMNVQFYYSKFEDAGQLFAVCHDLEAALGRRISRHVRYHSELRGGAQICIRSSIVDPIPDSTKHGVFVQHVMEETSTGRIAATALDWHAGTIDSPQPDIRDALSSAVMPRGLKNEADFGTKSPLAALDATMLRGVLRPAQCDAQGWARDQAYIGAISDAAAHAWDRIGLSSQWLDEKGFGRIAVEMRLCILTPMRAGTAYQVQLAFTGLQSRSYSKRYDFFDLRNGQHIGFLESAVMLLNHTTRKSEPLPDFARDALLGHLEKQT